jgi:hypothetical protein
MKQWYYRFLLVCGHVLIGTQLFGQYIINFDNTMTGSAFQVHINYSPDSGCPPLAAHTIRARTKSSFTSQCCPTTLTFQGIEGVKAWEGKSVTVHTPKYQKVVDGKTVSDCKVTFTATVRPDGSNFVVRVD